MLTRGVRPLLVSLLAATALVATALTSPSQAVTAPASPAWVAKAVIYEVNVRQFSEAGTFESVTAAIPRLKGLGVTTLWLMPIHPIGAVKRMGTLGSPYSVADYTEVDPSYGSKADFAALVAAAHEAGLTVILDWVANHTAWDHPWVSEHKDWYTQDNSGNIVHPAGTNWQDVADLNYSNSDLRAAMIAAMRYWVTEFDIDGFRCDVAGFVPTSFWNSARADLDEVKPLFWLAENSDSLSLLQSAFNANYAWPTLSYLNDLAQGNQTGKALLTLVKNLGINYPVGAMPMNFITNHDENAWNGTEFERMRGAVPVMTAIYFTLPGIPLIYNGQEINLNHRLSFSEKDPIDWSSGSDNDLLRSLARLKANNPALAAGLNGGTFTALPAAADSAVTYLRANGSDRVVVLANPSAKALTLTVDTSAAAGGYRDVGSGTRVVLPKGKLTLRIPARGFQVLDSQSGEAQARKATSVTPKVAAVTLKVKGKHRLDFSVRPAVVTDARVSFKSSNPKVAKVDALGLVTAVKPGKAVVSVQVGSGGAKASVRVTVK